MYIICARQICIDNWQIYEGEKEEEMNCNEQDIPRPLCWEEKNKEIKTNHHDIQCTFSHISAPPVT